MIPKGHHGVDRLGPRVPAIIVSAYTPPQTRLHHIFEHTSVLSTVVNWGRDKKKPATLRTRTLCLLRVSMYPRVVVPKFSRSGCAALQVVGETRPDRKPRREFCQPVFASHGRETFSTARDHRNGVRSVKRPRCGAPRARRRIGASRSRRPTPLPKSRSGPALLSPVVIGTLS
jgi:hypothetical protein